ncbi:exopolyphosphatase [Halanaerobacter jeridensis]|uniref:Exopolyphosphatase n=1 Tax=Halanaerobacter jeridensis TaxID=706427 RepID=A0A939BM92_9FIRM|nr:exopolyphosphatase [Halanaerobacter jeridensis]MBM7555860.1 exopolyphosphatase/guanosine-5'-triphosphate,3'-diphosphate pyrophosphatase [Halanaerobacter jeridensis]
MHNLAIIDIGSNSMKMVLAEVKKGHSFTIIDELKETVRLGEGMSIEKKLKQDRMDKAIQTLRMFKDLCDATDTEEIITVATAAVREATNRQQFLQRVKREIGLDVKVLSGIDEGYYDYWGVANSIDKEDGLIMDIGGGSIELIWMKDRKVKESTSLSFGALDITQNFDLYDSINEEQEKELEDFLHDAYQEVPWLSEMDHTALLGVGGTIKNIARIDQRKKDYPLNILHNYKMSNEAINDVYQLVKSKDLEERKNISGLSTKRADIFIGASAAVKTLIDFCDIKKLILSRKGIREGLIYHHLCRSDQPVKDVVNFSIKNIMNNFNLNQDHAYHIYKLSKSLYDQLKDLYELKPSEFNGDIDKIILVAAMMHDIGNHVNYYDHHEHSFYMLLNSGINGLSHRELLLSSYIAASHRHTKYSLHKYNLNRASLQKIINKNGPDKEAIRKTGILLEIAESLDRSMNGIVEAVQCSITDEQVNIKTIAREETELEINDALETAEGFEKLYGKKLNIY